MTPLDKAHAAKLYWILLVLYFLFFSFNAVATSLSSSLIGAKWDTLSAQQQFQTVLLVVMNWTGMMSAVLLKSLIRMGSGKPPIETGNTDRIRRD